MTEGANTKTILVAEDDENLKQLIRRFLENRSEVITLLGQDGEDALRIIGGFLTQMCARFSPQQVSHAVERGCGCVRARESAVKSSIAQSTAACAGPAFGGGPARRQPVPPQGAEALAFTGRRTMNTRGTRPGLSPTFYRWAEPSLTVQPLGTGRPLAISAVYRGPDFPRACSSSPDTDGVLQPRKSMTMLDLLAMEPAKAAPIPERNPSEITQTILTCLSPMSRCQARVASSWRRWPLSVAPICACCISPDVMRTTRTSARV